VAGTPGAGIPLAASKWEYVRSQCDLIKVNKSNAAEYFIAACLPTEKGLTRNAKAAAAIANVYWSEIEKAYADKDSRVKFAWDHAWVVSEDFRKDVQSMRADADNAPRFVANIVKGIGEYSDDATRRAQERGVAQRLLTVGGWVDGVLILPWNAMINAKELFTGGNFRIETPPYGTMIDDMASSVGNAAIYEKDPETGKRTSTPKNWRDAVADVLQAPAYFLWDLTTVPAWKEYNSQKQRLLNSASASPTDVDMVSNQYFQAWTDVALTATIAYGGAAKVAANAGEKMVFSRARLQLEKHLVDAAKLRGKELTLDEARVQAGDIINQIEKELATSRAGASKGKGHSLKDWYARAKGNKEVSFEKTKPDLPKTREQVANYISAKIREKTGQGIVVQVPGVRKMAIEMVSSAIDGTAASLETAVKKIGASAERLAGLDGYRSKMNAWLSEFKELTVNDVMLKRRKGITGSPGVRELPMATDFELAGRNIEIGTARASIGNEINQLIAKREASHSGTIVREFNARFKEQGLQLPEGRAAEKSTFASPSKKIIGEMENALTAYYKTNPGKIVEKNVTTQVEADILGILDAAVEKDMAKVGKNIYVKFGIEVADRPIMNTRYVGADLRGHRLGLGDKDKVSRLAEMIGRTAATDLPQGLSVKEAATLSELAVATGAAIKEVILNPLKLPSLQKMQERLASQKKGIEERITTNDLAINNIEIRNGTNPLVVNGRELSGKASALEKEIAELKVKRGELGEGYEASKRNALDDAIQKKEVELTKLKNDIKDNNKKIKKDAGLSAGIKRQEDLAKQNEKLRKYITYVETLESSIDAGIIEARIAYVKAAYSSFMGGGLTNLPGWVGTFDKWLFEKKYKKGYSTMSAEIKELDNGIAAIRARVYEKYDAWRVGRVPAAGSSLEEEYIAGIYADAQAGKIGAKEILSDMQRLGDLAAAKTYRSLKLSGIIAMWMGGIGAAGTIAITNPGLAIEAGLGMGMGYLDYWAIGAGARMAGENNFLKLMTAYAAEREAVNAADWGLGAAAVKTEPNARIGAGGTLLLEDISLSRGSRKVSIALGTYESGTSSYEGEWDGSQKELPISIASLAKIPKSKVNGHTDDWEIIYFVAPENGAGKPDNKPFFLSPSQMLEFDGKNRTMNIQFGGELYVKFFKDGAPVKDGNGVELGRLAFSELKSDKMTTPGTYRYDIYSDQNSGKKFFEITAIVK
ncbi:MAG: hypothetical protein WC588_04755, partial [Candidatus Micrarchaeia archaeon]